ncbi:MAG: UDP-N-acetylmuramate--L-alanine ligase [Candidatus Protochlamydia sp.]|nr:UDP-N-acetylmuramate--L-alanine ligase [Candidatus Protochlamydia sp.]
MSEHYHFIGIGGIGMSGLAKLLLDRNVSVSGSDIATNLIIEQLAYSGAAIYKGHAYQNISPGATVVYSTDIKTENSEYQASIELGCPIIHRSDLLAHLIKDRRSLAVTGTHGKTTTSALLCAVLMEANLSPSFAVGGIISQFQTNARSGKGDLFVFEADESDGSFLKYSPACAIITNIDNDHLNAYEGSIENLKEAFSTFIGQVSSPLIFWCGDDPYLKKMGCPGQSYGFEPQCDWKICSVKQEGFCQIFDLEWQGKRFSNIHLNLIGRHNILNATAVFSLAYALEVPEESIRQAFVSFKGVSRRCETKGELNGARFIDDYAHHPTEIRTTLLGLRHAIGSQKMIAVFQPHRFSRTKDCLGQFGNVFGAADEVIVTDIYASGEAYIPGLTAELIVKEIQACFQGSVQYVPRSALGRHLSKLVKEQDVVVTLGAGDVTRVAGEAFCNHTC